MIIAWGGRCYRNVEGFDNEDFGCHTSRNPALRGPSCLQKSIMSSKLITEANSAFSDTPQPARSLEPCYLLRGRKISIELLRPSGRPDWCLGSATYLERAVVIEPIIQGSSLSELKGFSSPKIMGSKIVRECRDWRQQPMLLQDRLPQKHATAHQIGDLSVLMM